MLFYVYMDPGVLGETDSQGQWAMEYLIEVLEKFVQNCLLLDFDGCLVKKQISDAINRLRSSPDGIKRIKELFVILWKRNRFVSCMTADCANEKLQLKWDPERLRKHRLDLLLLGQTCVGLAYTGLEATTLAKYRESAFAGRQKRLAENGCTLSEGELSEEEFLRKYLEKVFRHATTINLYDRQFGKNFGDNFLYNARRWLECLGRSLVAPGKCRFIIHTQEPESLNRREYIRDSLMERKAKLKGLQTLTMQVCYYKTPNANWALPHPRYLITDQVALEIDPGMDFLEKSSRKNRHLEISYKDPAELSRRLAEYSRFRSHTETIRSQPADLS